MYRCCVNQWAEITSEIEQRRHFRRSIAPFRDRWRDKWEFRRARVSCNKIRVLKSIDSLEEEGEKREREREKRSTRKYLRNLTFCARCILLCNLSFRSTREPLFLLHLRHLASKSSADPLSSIGLIERSCILDTRRNTADLLSD